MNFDDQQWDPDHLRARFCQAMSDMYKHEVPLYANLLSIVAEVDDRVRTSSIRMINVNSDQISKELLLARH